MAKTHHLHSKLFSSVVTFFNYSNSHHSNFQQSNQDCNEAKLVSDNESLLKSNKSLLLQNHHKSEFLASVAHELKNQIGAIISLSEFIKSDNLEVIAELEKSELKKVEPDKTESDKLNEAEINHSQLKNSLIASLKAKLQGNDEFISDINKTANDLLEFARDLMDVDQVESGDFSVNMNEEIDIIHVIKRAIKVNYDFSLRRRIAIEFDEKETIKEFLGSEVVRNFDISSTPLNLNASTATTPFPKIKLDQRRMKQILINLLSNSLKYSKEGTKIRINAVILDLSPSKIENLRSFNNSQELQQAKVREGGEKKRNILQITIKDQGFGMTEEEIELALQKHQKIENENSKKFDSFGLGLPMVKRLVELQKGKLDIKSEAGNGSEFILRFPF